MRKATLIVIAFVMAALAAGLADAKQKSIAGNWTLSVESLPLKLVLAQNGRAVTGTMDYPHGTPFRLTGTFKKDKLTFSGDSTGDNFTVHVQAASSLNADGSLAGTLNAHFIERDDAQKVVRTRDQVMTWTAVRRNPLS
jgi:hypothetical protein